jgi:thymidylate synthase (FAD)
VSASTTAPTSGTPRHSTRPSSTFLDTAIAADPTLVLDHGFLRVVDYMGDESSIVRAARQSYASDPAPRPPLADRQLLRYLVRHRHTSPLEMCELAVQARLPIFVARQWIRHRTASVNELSGRYSVLDSEFYLPELAQLCGQSVVNKQGRSEPIGSDRGELARGRLRESGESAFALYDFLLAPDGAELARETARINLPLSTYTTWTWKCDLHNLLHFLSLRLDPHAQWEIRQYAEVIWRWVVGWVPIVAEAFEEFRLRAVTFTRRERALLAALLRDSYSTSAEALSQGSVFETQREREEFLDKLRGLGAP